MARDLGIANLIAEVVSLLTDKSSNRLISLVINECRDALQLPSNFKLQHCYRVANKAVDSRMGYCQVYPLLYYSLPLDCVLPFLSLDTSYVCFPK